jgi:riboflavin kinase / FMN adenylyltransferase
VSPLEPIIIDNEPASSTRVRALLSGGEMAVAEKLLGRRFSMFGRVVHGAQLGRTLGFPTANMRIWKHPPLKGIFAVRINGIKATPMHAVSCVGTRPTVDGREWLLETFVFDFDGDLYGKRLEVEFVEKLRDELKFDSLEALKIQMHLDAEQARAVLRVSQFI